MRDTTAIETSSRVEKPLNKRCRAWRPLNPPERPVTTFSSMSFRMVNGKTTFLIVGALLASSLAAAKPPEDEDKQKKDPRAVLSETVTITAEADTIEVKKTPNPVIVVDAKKIEQIGSSRLTRILEFAFPGRTVPMGGPGTESNIFINGARSEDTVVVLDGIRISDQNLWPSTNYFSICGVDRVEVLTGPASTLYGADAHGGVISMSSRGPSGTGFSGYMLGQGSTHGQMRAGMLVSYGWDKGWFQGSGDSEQSPQSIDTKNPYRQASGHIGIGQQIGETWLLTANHRSGYIGAPTPFVSDRTVGYEQEALTWQNFTTASAKGYFSDNFFGELNLGNISQGNINDANTASAASPKLDRNQGNARVTWKSHIASVTLLGDFIDEELRSNFWNDNLYGFDYNVISSARHTAFALESSMEPLPVLRFVGSVRQQSDALNPYNETEVSESQMTWKAGANLLLPSGFRGYISTGTSFNTPSLSQINSNIRVGKDYPGNESSRSILAGVGYDANKWWVRADANRINYNELLQYAYIDPANWQGLYYHQVDGRIQVQGLELTAGIRGNDWDTEIWARSQEARDLDAEDTPFSSSSTLARRPFFSCGLRANWVLRTMNYGMNLSYIGHRYSVPLGAWMPTPNKTHYVDCSLWAGMQFGKSITATLRAERLFQDGISTEEWEAGKDIGRNNVGYEEGFPSLGRALSLEVRYRF